MDYENLRKQMVKFQLEMRDITDKRVLNAMASVPRHLFVPTEIRENSYSDTALPIYHRQTISQPYIVALMTQLLKLKKDDIVLEIGTGSGYHAAIIAKIAKKVYTMERVVELYNEALILYEALDFNNIVSIIGDGSKGLLGKKFNKIIVTAHSKTVPEVLLRQLKLGGKLVMPIGEPGHQKLVVYTKYKTKIKEESILDCVFVPLIED